MEDALLIELLRDGRLDAAEQSALADRLRKDPVYRRQLAATRIFDRRIAAVLATPAPTATATRFLHLLRARRPSSVLRTVRAVKNGRGRKSGRHRRSGWLAVAALLMICALIGGMLNRHSLPAWRDEAGHAVAMGSKINAGTRDLVLTAADGSVLRLAPGGRLRLDSERHLQLIAGELTVHATRRPPEHMLRIVCAQALAEVIGTRFTLTVNTDAAGLLVNEGLVRLSAQGRAIEVEAGTMALADAHGLRAMTSLAVPAVHTVGAMRDIAGVVLHVSPLKAPYERRDDLVLPVLQRLGIRHVLDGIDENSQRQWSAFTAAGVRMTLAVPALRNASEAVPWLRAVGPGLEGVTGPADSDVRRDGRFAAPEGWYQGKVFPDATRSLLNDLGRVLAADAVLQEVPLLIPQLFQAENMQRLAPLPPTAGVIMSAMPGYAPPEAALTRLSEQAALLAPGRRLQAVIGWHTHPTGSDFRGRRGVDPRVHAAYCARALATGLRLGLERVIFYELLDEPESASDGEGAFGLCRSDGQDKPAGGALARLLGGNRPGAPRVEVVSPPPRISAAVAVDHVVMATDDGGLVLLIWRPVALAGSDAASITIASEMVLVEASGWREAEYRDLLESGEAKRIATPLVMVPLAGGVTEIRLRR